MTTLLELPVALGQPEAAFVLEQYLGQPTATRVVAEFDGLKNLLAPMVRVSSRSSLEGFLREAAPHVVTRIGRVQALLEGTPSAALTAMFKEILSLSSEGIVSAARARADMVGPEALDQLLGALMSLEGLTAATLEATEMGGVAAQRMDVVVPVAGEPYFRAVLCIAAVGAILSDVVSDWSAEAIPILCSAADEWMSDVEDAFLSTSRHRPITEDELVDLEHVQRTLGL